MIIMILRILSVELYIFDDYADSVSKRFMRLLKMMIHLCVYALNGG